MYHSDGFSSDRVDLSASTAVLLNVNQSQTVALAEAQSTQLGKIIHGLKLWHDRVYMTYGDYEINTGPIHVLSALPDSALQIMDEFTAKTEQFFRPSIGSVSNTLYMPYIDPQGFGDDSTGEYASATTPGNWSQGALVSNPSVIHMEDIIETVDGVFAVGSGCNGADYGTVGTAIIWHLINGVWVKEYSETDTSTVHRFYSLCTFGDTIVALSDFRTLMRTSGANSTWTDIPFVSVVDRLASFTINGVYFWLAVTGDQSLRKPQIPTVITLPGVTFTEDPYNTFGYVTDAKSQTYLWLLGPSVDFSTVEVRRIDAQGNVVIIGNVDPLVVSIEVDEAHNYIYLGTSDSRILQIVIP